MHGDLSEYNMLYLKGHLYFIDVSQSVEHDHPRALEFLRMDCANVTAFFKKKGLAPLAVVDLFEFITHENLADEDVDAYLDHAAERVSERAKQAPSAKEQVDEAVFMQTFIPRSLGQVTGKSIFAGRPRVKFMTLS